MQPIVPPMEKDRKKSTEWPLYKGQSAILGSRKSQVGIVTLWTPNKLIADKIPSEKYAVIDNLFSMAGISFLVRNLLANPSVRYLVLCGADKSGSGRALKALFEKGIDSKYVIIGQPGYSIDREIGTGAIELLRRNVELIDMIGVLDGLAVLESIEGLKTKDAYSKPMVFDEPKIPEYDSIPESRLMRIDLDPKGNLVVSTQGRNILVDHYSPHGRLMARFRALTAYRMYKLLLSHDIISELEHAMYIGTELQKAELAIKLGLKYVQDQPLAKE